MYLVSVDSMDKSYIWVMPYFFFFFFSCDRRSNCVNFYTNAVSSQGCFLRFLKLNSALCCSIQVGDSKTFPENLDSKAPSIGTLLAYHSSLEDYLAQVTYAKNCPTTFYCIFQIGMGSYDHRAKYQGVFP